ncbi:MAG: tRNA (N(6)-L-threonylcarbamoyladenosine(37)-C(2))-methylthiotransferase MtaB [Clostridia bacterium]|nr:tRNA (N(6)-L-threonylcarbamoyladenosine(37)-C(2))-methylthiotransferase MtaB [Clostridia bacterium]
MQKKIGIITLGCKVNQYESEAFAEELRKRGYLTADGGEDCDGYIVNTCTVTAEADRKSRQMIRRAARAKEGVPVVVTGCTAEYSAEELSEIDGVIAVCGNAKKLECVDILDNYFKDADNEYPIVSVPPIEDAEFEKMSLNAFPRTRVYIKIEDGCENKCAYCAIPKARGNVRSKAPEDILREVNGFIDAGCREIVLTGIETASYGKDIDGIDLGRLLRLVDAIAEDCKIRLGSLDPSLFKEKFVNEIKDLSSLAPHFHISLQSGSSKVLALMRRKYNADMAREAMERLRGAIPNVMFTTDIIVGFPGEGEEEFEQTVEFVKEARFLSAHIFPYSEREGTPASQMDGKIPVEIRRERAAKLIEIQKEITEALLAEEIAREPERIVLFETYSNGIAHGHTDSFLEVSAPAPYDLHGERVKVKLNRCENGICHGEIAKGDLPAAKPVRKQGLVSGFRTCTAEYLARIDRDLGLELTEPQLAALQSLYVSQRKDPTVAELYFMAAAIKKSVANASFNRYIDKVTDIDDDARDLLADITRRYAREAGIGDNAPSILALAEYASTGKIGRDMCGIDISLSSLPEYIAPYSGSSRVVASDDFVLTFSSGKPISGKKIGNIGVILAPGKDDDVYEFLDKAQQICRKFLKEYPDVYVTTAGTGSLIDDLSVIEGGLLIDTSLLPNPSRFADDVFLPQAPAIILFADKERLPALWKIASGYGITPSAPIAKAKSGLTVKAAEGDVKIDRDIIKKFELSLPIEIKYDAESFIETKESGIEKSEIPGTPFALTERYVGGEHIYEDLAEAMAEGNAVYAIAGIIDPNDPAVISAILTLDSFRRNKAANIESARFFMGEKTSICVYRLTEKK